MRVRKARFSPAKVRALLGSDVTMKDAPRPLRMPRTIAAALVALTPLAISSLVASGCDPAYEPPPKAPASVYIPWNAGPARGARRAAGTPTAAPSLAPSVQLEEYDESAAGAPSGSAAASAPATP
jgi:hypothetical protein